MLQYLSNFLRFERFNLRYSDWGRSTLQERCISDISSFDFRGRSGGVIGGEYHCVAEMFLSWSLGKAETALPDSIAGSTFHQILQAFYPTYLTGESNPKQPVSKRIRSLLERRMPQW
jgi:hypothetical protein